MKINKEQLQTVEAVIKQINRCTPGSTLRVEDMQVKGPQNLVDYVETMTSEPLILETTQAFAPQVVSYPQNGETYTIKVSKDGSYFMTRKLDIGGVTQLESTIDLQNNDILEVKDMGNVTPEDIRLILSNLNGRGRAFGL
jgi:hypothetical protein